MKFTINGKEYEGAKYNFNTSCLFEELGVNIADIGKKPMGLMRAYLAISSGMDVEEAGNEIEQHLINGGNLVDIQNVLGEEMNNSGFFKSLLEKVTTTEETQEKKTKK